SWLSRSRRTPYLFLPDPFLHCFVDSSLLSSASPALEKILHLGKEAARFGLGRARALLVEFHQQFAVAPGEILGRFHHRLNVQVAEIAAAQDRHALAPQAELFAGLGAFGDMQLGLPAIER